MVIERRASAPAFTACPASKWIDNQRRPNCTLCKTSFSLTTRRHHCRICGDIYCNDCCPVREAFVDWSHFRSSPSSIASHHHHKKQALKKEKTRFCLSCNKNLILQSSLPVPSASIPSLPPSSINSSMSFLAPPPPPSSAISHRSPAPSPIPSPSPITWEPVTAPTVVMDDSFSSPFTASLSSVSNRITYSLLFIISELLLILSHERMTGSGCKGESSMKYMPFLTLIAIPLSSVLYAALMFFLFKPTLKKSASFSNQTSPAQQNSSPSSDVSPSPSSSRSVSSSPSLAAIPSSAPPPPPVPAPAPVPALSALDLEIRSLGEIAGDTIFQRCISNQDWTLKADDKENETTVWTTVINNDGYGPKHRRIFKAEAIMHVPPHFLFEWLYDIDRASEWNKSIHTYSIRKKVDDRNDITYCVSAPAAGGVVSSRDFISVRHVRKYIKKDGKHLETSKLLPIGHEEEQEGKIGVYSYTLAGLGIPSTLYTIPPNPAWIRGNSGPSGYVIEAIEGHRHRCRLYWLLDSDLKGWLPKSVIDNACTTTMIDFNKYLRKLISEQYRQRKESGRSL